jgi:hypothetical protein
MNPKLITTIHKLVSKVRYEKGLELLAERWPDTNILALKSRLHLM